MGAINTNFIPANSRGKDKMIIDKDRKPTPLGEWEIDSDGRRFRYDGRCIEYESTITTSHGTLTMNQLRQMNERETEKPALSPAKFPSVKHCPLKTGAHTACDGGGCAWFTSEGCSMKCPHPAAGKKCPYTHTTCTNNCALREEITNE